MRLFLAIPVEGRAARTLAAVQADLKVGRLVDPDDFHVTLAFLGEVPGALQDDLGAALDALALPPVRLEIRGIGHFGHDAPRQVWAGVAEDAGLTRAHAKVERAARSAGLRLDRRRFVPHVTLGRLKGRVEDTAAVATFAAKHGALSLEPLAPRETVLYASHLRADGPLYGPLESFRFG